MRFQLLLLIVAYNGFGQTFYCSYSGGECAAGIHAASPIAINVVNNVCSVLNIPNIPVYQSSVADACAFADNYGNPNITYNPVFLNFLFSNNQWAPISVLAHEVGHHYAMHSTWYGSFLHSWTRELQADYVSGYVLYKLGCPSVKDALAAMNLMFNYTGTISHPDTPKRMDALIHGYVRASQGY